MSNMDTGLQNIDEIEIDLKDLFLELKAKWLYMLMGLIAGISLAVIITVGFIKPTYKASSMIYMRGSGNSIASIADLQIGSALTNDYAVIFKSRTLLTQVIDSLGLDMEYEQVKSLISITNPSDTRILEVTVTCGDAILARNIANKVVEYGADAAKEIDSKEPYMIDQAVIEEDKVGPSLTKNSLIGGVIGLILVAAFFVVRYVLNDALQDEDDIERYLSLPVLCQIPESKNSDYHDNNFNKKKSHRRNRK